MYIFLVNITTRAMEQKLEELKRSIEDRFDKQKDSLREIISEICSALKKDLKEELKKEMDEQITKISSENCMFQNQILELKQANVELQNEFDELEQYGRRSCIRIHCIPDVSNESSEDVFDNIVDMFVRVGIEGIEQNIDRAHRIGKSYHHKISKKKCKSIIVKFSSFRYRTKAYRQKKNLDDGLTAHVDLTKKRHSLLRKANDLVRNRDEVLFCCADINCRLKRKWADQSKQDKLFSSLDELNEIMGEQFYINI